MHSTGAGQPAPLQRNRLPKPDVSPHVFLARRRSDELRQNSDGGAPEWSGVNPLPAGGRWAVDSPEERRLYTAQLAMHRHGWAVL